MPRGKLTAEQLDGNLTELRVYVCAHLAELGPRAKASLKACFALQVCDEERRVYLFLHKHEKRFTEAQRTHMDETLALLMQHGKSSGDLHPAAGAGSEAAPSSSLKRDLSSVPVGDDEHIAERAMSDTPPGLRSRGASSSGGAHPAEDALPTLDDAILHAVRKFGRFPA